MLTVYASSSPTHDITTSAPLTGNLAGLVEASPAVVDLPDGFKRLVTASAGQLCCQTAVCWSCWPYKVIILLLGVGLDNRPQAGCHTRIIVCTVCQR